MLNGMVSLIDDQDDDEDDNNQKIVKSGNSTSNAPAPALPSSAPA